MNARTDKAELAQRMTALAANNTLVAERDKALMQRDQARRETQILETRLRIVTNERDEARALGRCA